MTDPDSPQRPPWRCYFLDANSGCAVSADSPLPVELPVALELTAVIVCQPRFGFVGLIDAHDLVVQFAGQAGGEVIMDVPCPERKGSWQARLSPAECCRRVKALAEHGRIDVANYPDLDFVQWPPGASEPLPAGK
ncbi:MAG: hypothetical protein JRD89_02250 [Deltaproteobacteria bacterium]|nr:hypothetical protein [Deltaproteobacteria bacterium]